MREKELPERVLEQAGAESGGAGGAAEKVEESEEDGMTEDYFAVDIAVLIFIGAMIPVGIWFLIRLFCGIFRSRGASK